jgi:hypothetical protein
LDYGWLIRNKIANHFGIPEWIQSHQSVYKSF